MKRPPISRRTFLRGCGAAVPLPLLDAMRTSSSAAIRDKSPAPIRTAFFYIPNGVVQSAWHPKDTGTGFELSATLEPLKPVRKKISLFTKLDRIKVAGTDGHAQASTCWLSSAAPDQLSPAGYPLKRTIDQIIAAETGKYTPFRSLELSCNPYEDNRESVYFNNISWYGHGHVARSLRDPKLVFQRLFSLKQQNELGSVIDLVRDDAQSLRRKLGRLDREKLGEYLDSVRAVELQIQRVRKRQSQIAKLKLQPPVKPWQQMKRGEYIQVMGDLMILALQTDLTRVASLMSGPERWGSPLTVHGVFDRPINHHSMTHSQGRADVRKRLEQLDRFHLAEYAKLVAKMDAIREGESTLLDNTMFVLGSGISSGKLHVYTDLPTIIAGSGGGRLATNRHTRFAAGTPLANLWLSLARANGVKTNRIADSTGSLTGFSG